MGQNVNPIIIAIAVIVVVAGLGFIGWRSAEPPTPRAGSYTPGVPPWLDKSSPEYGKGPNVVAQKH